MHIHTERFAERLDEIVEVVMCAFLAVSLAVALVALRPREALHAHG